MDLRDTLIAGIAQACRAALATRPPLDLAVQKGELVRQFPRFADMNDEQRLQLTRNLRTVYAAPGDRLIRQGDPPNRVWFIASGAVEVTRAGQQMRLGRGEMFGHLAVLGRTFRRGQVVAIAPCTLLTLDEVQFKALLARNSGLKDAVLLSAAQRGITLDLIQPDPTPG
jgi:CPA1 family monovalent cation:H+ antiporter